MEVQLRRGYALGRVHLYTEGGHPYRVAVLVGKGGHRQIGAGRDADGAAPGCFHAVGVGIHREDQVIPLVPIAEVTEIQHQMQRRIGAGSGVQIGLGVHKAMAGGVADIQPRRKRGVYLAVTVVVKGHAVGIGQGVGQEAGAVFVDQEGVQLDGVAVHLHSGIHGRQVVAHQPPHGLGVGGYPLHLGQAQHVAGVIQYDGGLAVHAVGAEGVQVGGGDAGRGRYIGLDKTDDADTCRTCHGNTHGQYRRDQHTLGDGMAPMGRRFLLLVYRPVYL